MPHSFLGTRRDKLQARANTTIIGRQAVADMPNGTWTTIILVWNTTDCIRGGYTISAYAKPPQNETHVADNTYVGGIVIVTIPGDVNGDRQVDVADLVDLNKAYGSTFGSLTWNANCDISGGSKVDVLDLLIHARTTEKPTHKCPEDFSKTGRLLSAAAWRKC